MKRLALAIVLLLSACKSPKAPEEKPVAVATPAFFAERGVVLEAIESSRLGDAEQILSTAADTADVHFLRAKTAMARGDGESAYREAKKAVEKAPDWPEYQYELGTIAPFPVGNLGVDEVKARHVEGGKALARAVALKPDEPRYLYARAFFLTVEPPETGGNPGKGLELFESIRAKHPDSQWAHRVSFDVAAEKKEWKSAEEHAAQVGALDAKEGARLWLQLAGSYLAETKSGNATESLERTRAAIESAAKLHPPAAGGFCDAGFALDGGGHRDLADPFWKRCLELDPAGPKSAQARERLEK